MHITVDTSRCQGHAQCAAMSGGFYELDDDGFIATTSTDVTPGDEVNARTGAEACPERAITVA